MTDCAEYDKLRRGHRMTRVHLASCPKCISAPPTVERPSGVITREALIALVQRNLKVPEMALELRVDPASVQRGLRQFGLAEQVYTPQRRFSPDEIDRIAALTAEGMPATWIAEDLGRSPHQVRKLATKMPGAKERAVEWRRAWPKISKNPTLLGFHEKFAPREMENA